MPERDIRLQRRHTVERIWRFSAGLLIGGTILAILVLAYTPPVSRDALTHHLAVPQLYLDKGGIHEIPEYTFSYYPMNLDLLYLIPLALGNDILPKYIHFSFALLTACLIFFYLRRATGPAAGILGVLMFLSLPIIVKLSITVYVDLGLIFFSTAALFACLQWKESGYRRRHLILAASFCGLALGTKYNGLITFFLLTLLIIYMYAWDHRRTSSYRGPALTRGLAFVVVALLVFSPWLIKNYAWTGNPVYPLFDSVFRTKPTPSAVIVEKVQAVAPPLPLDHFSIRHHGYGESTLEIALVPLRVFFQGRDDNPKYFDGVLNPYLCLLPLCWLILSGPSAFRERSASFYLFGYAILYLLFVFFRHDMRIRYIGPIIPPLIILSVNGFFDLLRFVQSRLQGAGLIAAQSGCVLMLAALLAVNYNYMAGQFRRITPLEYISGQVSRADYISRFRPEYRLHVYAGRNLPANARILGLFLGNRRYYSQREIVFDDHLLKELIHGDRSAEAVGKQLEQRGITHLMIRHDLFEKWVGDNFSPAEITVLQEFFGKRLFLLQAVSGYVLYALQ